MQKRKYIAIDLKSFYASVECAERCLNPLTTNLVVADATRTEKTICLAVSPSLKAYGIPGRARLFEIIEKVDIINKERIKYAPGHKFTDTSIDSIYLSQHPEAELSYITAPPRMSHYMKFSSDIYEIYLKYIAPEDIHVYSVDEVFMDVTGYLDTYKLTAKELAEKIIHEVLSATGITATAGIGTNLYLCKIAMDIVAKHSPPDSHGVRIAELDEMSYRRLLWSHTPITDFWRVGRGYREKLASVGLYTMGDIALCSIGKNNEYYNEDLLYKLFGINAELLIDHAWGWEPCTIDRIKAYKPSVNSISSGQVLHCGYDFEKTRIITLEMADALALDLVAKKLTTDQIVLTIGYDKDSLTQKNIHYTGPVTTDYYGRRIPKHAHGTARLTKFTSSTKIIIEAVSELYDRIVNPSLLIRRITIAAGRVKKEEFTNCNAGYEQLDLLSDYDEIQKSQSKTAADVEKEKRMQNAILEIKNKYGKNAVLKGLNYKEGATARDRNSQIGGHRA